MPLSRPGEDWQPPDPIRAFRLEKPTCFPFPRLFQCRFRLAACMLVSALMGREEALRVYDTAVRERYRFFSFGDCMLIL